jgi:hypothetical protein
VVVEGTGIEVEGVEVGGVEVEVEVEGVEVKVEAGTVVAAEVVTVTTRSVSHFNNEVVLNSFTFNRLI